MQTNIVIINNSENSILSFLIYRYLMFFVLLKRCLNAKQQAELYSIAFGLFIIQE